MSATVVDALLVTLGLDPSNFTAGTTEITINLNDLREESKKTAKDMADDGKKAAEFFTSIRNEMLALVGVSLSLKAVKDTIVEATRSMADLGRTSTLIGESARTVDAWGNAVKGFGGEAKDAQATMLGLQDSITSFQMTGQSNSTTQTLRAMGIQFLDENNQPRKSSDILLEVARYFEKINATPQQARQFGKMAGIDQSMINMLMQGESATRKFVAEQEKKSVVDEQQTKNAMRMEAAWRDLGTQWNNTKLTLTEALQPGIMKTTELLDDFSDWVNSHEGDIHKFFDELPDKVQPVIDELKKLEENTRTLREEMLKLLGIDPETWSAKWEFENVIEQLTEFGKMLNMVAELLTAVNEGRWADAAKVGKKMLEQGSDKPPAQAFVTDSANETADWIRDQTGFDPRRVGGWFREKLGFTPQHSLTPDSSGFLKTMSGTFAALESKYGLPEDLLKKVAMVESSGNPMAVGPETKYGRARGLFQLMPSTARWLGLKDGEEFDPQKASDAAARYLSQLIRQFGGNVNTALAAYNWGPGNVSKFGLENAPKETRDYLQKINGGMSIGAAARFPLLPAGRAGGNAVHNETHIGQINITTQATDAEGIAKEIPAHLKRNSLIYQADSGMS